ncbi:rarD protein [Salinisphaera dokdonensis CL-ES53]|uniref:RarD protein n=1 Tax=Salinisphaera dokdonensis CL-ES53 TaxID=1304272 RepID=A0ABV2AZS4_9GAMM
MSSIQQSAALPVSRIGLAAAFGAFLSWGFLPLYFHLIGPRVSAWEILLHRVLWTALLLAVLTLALGRIGRIRAVFANTRLCGALVVTALLVATNWGTFIWAVVNSHVVDASLGYYINPLLNIALGFLFLGERLRRLQWVAVAIAALGVLLSIIAYGAVPWVALILAMSFGFYGLIRKQLAVDSVTGLLVETLFLAPIALVWLVTLYAQGDAAFGLIDIRTDALLIGAGIFTIVPFTLFAAGARRLRLGTLGLIQYLTPTLQFLTGVLILGERFTPADIVTFACIWTGLAIYTIDLLRASAHRPAAV